WRPDAHRRGDAPSSPPDVAERCSRALPVRRNVEAEQSRGVETEDLRARGVGEPAHRALDRLGGVRPRALVMRVVVAPHEIVGEVHGLGQREPCRVLLERREAVLAQIFAWYLVELGTCPA